MRGDGSAPEPVAIARARWANAEARLYPQVMMDPETYERMVRAVGAVVAEMRERTASAEDVVALEAHPGELLAAMADQRAAVPELGDQVLLEAACALRDRELPRSPGG